MAKSDLTGMEASGVLRKVKLLSTLDDHTGIIKKEIDSIAKMHRVGLDTFAAGGFNEVYGLDIMNRIIGGNGMKAVSATRANQVASFSVVITSVFDDRTIIVKYPHGGYN